MFNMRCFRASGLLLLTLLLPQTVNAQSGPALNLGGADSGPVVGNPAAIFWNPAALGKSEGFELLIDIETAIAQGSYQRAPDINSLFYPEVTADVLFPVPFFGMAHDFGLKKWRFGLGVYTPFGSGGRWDPNGPQRFHLIDGTEVSIYFTTTATYKVTPKFFVGVGVSYVLSVLQGAVSLDLSTTTQDLLPPSFGGVPTESPLFEAFAETSIMFGNDVTGTIGLFYEAADYLDLGISFHLPVDVTVTGEIDVTLPNSLALGQPALAFLGFDGSTVRADGQINFLRPALIITGFMYEPAAYLQLEGTFVYAFSRFRDQFVAEIVNSGLPYLDAPEGTSRRDTGANDSYSIKVGATAKINKSFSTAGFLTFVESGIADSHVTASNVGFNVLVPTWMLKYKYEEDHLFSFSLSPIIAFDRNVTNSIFDPTARAGSGIGLPPGNGLWKGFGALIGLSYAKRF